MARKRRRELILAAAALALAAIAVRIVQPGAGRPGAPAAPTAAPAASRGSSPSPVTELDLAVLEAERPQPEGARRNPFRFRPPPSPSPTAPGPRSSAGLPSADIGTAGPVEPPAPRIPLKYIGDMTDPQRPGRKVAILSDTRGVYYGREGDVIEGRYRIVRIGVESIELAYLDGRGRQTIRQTGQ